MEELLGEIPRSIKSKLPRPLAPKKYSLRPRKMKQIYPIEFKNNLNDIKVLLIGFVNLTIK